jgi:hypothetical protein
MTDKNFSKIIKKFLLTLFRAAKPNIKKEETIDENFNDFLKLVFNYAGPPIKLTDNKAAWPNQIGINNLKLNAVGRLLNDLFDFRFVAGTDKQINLDRENLPKIVVKHVVCLFMAFKQFNNFELAMKKEVVLQFAHMIIEDVSNGGQDWKKYSSQGMALDAQMLYQDVIKDIQFEQNSCRWIQEESSKPAMVQKKS